VHRAVKTNKKYQKYLFR